MPVDDVRLTTTVARVLRVFLEDPEVSRYGFDLMRQTSTPSGTLYPILARLERAGWITSEREAIDPAVNGRPARRMYTLTADGAASARIELARLSAELSPPRVARGLRPARGSL